MMPLEIVIVGRPNVGKSTLFNRMAGRRLALVDKEPGLTRDRREGEANLAGLEFTVVDTAGLEEAERDTLNASVQFQTHRAMAEADVALLLIDSRAGITPLDQPPPNLLALISTSPPVTEEAPSSGASSH